MKLSRLKQIIKEEVQKLHEVKPFVDPKLKTKPTDPVQYIATNDHRYPSELAFLDIKKNEIVFFNIQRKEVQRVSMERLNSTHWVRDYLPGGAKADVDMDKVFQKGRIGSRLTDEDIESEDDTEFTVKLSHLLDKHVSKGGEIDESLPKFKTPFEAYSWIMNKRGEAMDIEQEMMDTNADIQQLYGDMEQEAEAGGGPKADRYGREIEALENQHKDLRAQFNMVMAEIDEYDQNY